MKNLLLWIYLSIMAFPAYGIHLAEKDLSQQLKKEIENIAIKADDFDLLFSAVQNLGGDEGTAEALSQYIGQFKTELSEEQYINALSFFMDLGKKEEIKHIFSEALPIIAKFSKKDNEITCDTYIYQGLLANKLSAEMDDLVKEVNHPICIIQAELLKNSAINNIRPKKELWFKLIEQTEKWPQQSHKNQAFYYLAGELAGYEIWTLFPLLLEKIQDEKTLFKIYTLYFNAINESENIVQKTHNEMVKKLQKDVKEKSQTALKDATLALQAAGFIPQMQSLLAPNLNDIDERFLLGLIVEFAHFGTKNYALNLAQNLKDPFIKASAYASFTQYFGTQPLAGDDPYLDETLAYIEDIKESQQRDYIYLQLMKIAAGTGATDTALSLASQVKEAENKELAYALLSLSLHSNYEEETAEYIVKNILPPFLSEAIMNRLVFEQRQNWFEIMAQFSSLDAIESQLSILGEEAFLYEEKIIDSLINNGRYKEAEKRLEAQENPWLKLDKYLHMAFAEEGEEALAKANLILEQTPDLYQSHHYLDNIVNQLLLLEQQEPLDNLYLKATTSAQKIAILSSLLSYIKGEEEGQI